jgi:two-component system sensor histidine kinase KdpD
VAEIPLPQAEKLLVCVGPSPASAQLIHATKRLATALEAQWVAVYVETPKMLRLPEAERRRAAQNLRLAEELGGQTSTLMGKSIAAEIINFGRQKDITQIIAGKPTRRSWLEIFSKSPVDELVRAAGEIDIHIISGEPGEQRVSTYFIEPKHIPLADYGSGFLYFILATVLCFLMFPYFHLSNLIMVYLLGVLITAMECGRGPAILISLVSVLAFDFCFVPPRFSFTVEEAQYIVTFAVMFLVAVVISHLTDLIRRQALAARLQARQTAAMYALSRELTATRGVENILQVAVKHISEIFACQVAALLPDEAGRLKVRAGEAAIFSQDIVKEFGVARWAFENGQMAGWGTQTLPPTEILYVPLQAAHATLGVLAVHSKDPERSLSPEEARLLEALVKLVTLPLEVEHLQKTTLATQ